MTVETALILIAIVIFGLFQIISGIYVWFTRLKFQKQIRIEKTRSHFAKIRNDLTKMAREEKLDPNNSTFGKLHTTTTFVMRRPDQHDQISRVIVNVLFGPQTERLKQQLHSEEIKLIKSNKEIRELYNRLAQGFGLLIIDHSWIRRKIATIEIKTGIFRKILTVILFILKFLAEIEEKNRPEIRKIEETKKGLQTSLRNLAY